MDESNHQQESPAVKAANDDLEVIRYWTSQIESLFLPHRKERIKAVRPKSQAALDRILMRITVSESGCWEWNGAKSTAGYGRVKHKDGKHSFIALPHRVVAHAMGLIGSVRAVPKKNEVVMHSCDNPLCCRPDHLSAGTMADNTADCIRKGRANWQKQS